MPGVHVLVQRCDEASLLVDNADAWVHIAKGLVLNVSFSKVATPADVDKASASLLSIPLMTVGQWGDRTKPAAITSLLQDGHEVNILVIPQASLVSKVRGKTLQVGDLPRVFCCCQSLMSLPAPLSERLSVCCCFCLPMRWSCVWLPLSMSLPLSLSLSLPLPRTLLLPVSGSLWSLSVSGCLWVSLWM